jgi:phage portal protein BeeE
MGLFSRKKSASEVVFTPTFIPLSLVNEIFNNGNASDKKLLTLYLTVPELQAILNYRARAFADMKVKAVQNEEERDIPQLGLFAQPNPLQGFKEYAMQYHLLRDIFGNAYEHPVFGSDPKMTQAIWNLPPTNAEIIPADNNMIPFNATESSELIKEYHFYYDGKKIIYQPEEIIHYNDNQVQFDSDNFLQGQSKLIPLVQACENIKAAYEARGILIQNSALGILSNAGVDQVGTTQLDPKEKKELQEDYKRYGLSKSKWQLIMTNAALKWQSMATDVGKLKLFDEVDSDFRTIANAYSFPPEILQTDSTYENKSKAIKQLYQDVIIPEANEWLQAKSNFMGLENISFVSDYSHVPELQADLKERATSLVQAARGIDIALANGSIDSATAQDQMKKYLL